MYTGLTNLSREIVHNMRKIFFHLTDTLQQPTLSCMDNLMQVGQLITTLRVANGLSQRQLAKIIACSPETINRWEHGKGGWPKLDAMQKLAAALNVSLALFERRVT